MTLQPNTQLGYKDGKKRITVWLREQVAEGEYAGLIDCHVNVKQASKSWSAGHGLVDPVTHQVTYRNSYDCSIQEYINEAVVAN